MKVFLSWSGELSHKIACAFREWLPSVIQSITPYVSSEDIDKGTRWSNDIAVQLEDSDFGIIFVTKDNIGAPWISFEAGALSKSIDRSNVTPFILGLKRSEVHGPLLQFQSVIYDRSDIFKLLQSINARLDRSSQLSVDPLQKSFEVWWPKLDEVLAPLATQCDAEMSGDQPPNGSVSNDILEEILELARRQERLLRDPETLIPAGYIRKVAKMANAFPRSQQNALFEATKKIRLLKNCRISLGTPDNPLVIGTLKRPLWQNGIAGMFILLSTSVLAHFVIERFTRSHKTTGG